MSTKISYVHGVNRIGANDRAGRGGLLRSSEYIPFTELSKGQFDLMVQLNHARMLADYSRDQRYIIAENMLNRALKGDDSLSGIGVIDPMLYDVAAFIKRAKKDILPVSRLVSGSSSINALFDCNKYVYDNLLRLNLNEVKEHYGTSGYETKLKRDVDTGAIFDLRKPFPQQLFRKPISIRARGLRDDCSQYTAVEEVYNANLQKVQHHSVYNQINPNWKYLPSKATTKALLHNGAREGLANFALIDQTAFRTWMETLMQRQNVVTSQIEFPYTSVDTGFSINKSNNRVQLWNLYNQTNTKAKNDKIGEPVTIAAVTALVIAVTGAIAAAAEMQRRLNEKRQGALSEIRGYGTSSLSADPNDWDGDGIPNDIDDTPNGEAEGIDTNTMLLIGGGLAAAYFLTQDK